MRSVLEWLLLTVLIAGLLWPLLRGPQLSRRLRRPAPATRPRAITGLVWLVAVVVGSWLGGLRGLVPLLGDAIFIAFAGMVCLEWYVWWTLPEWLGKLTELAVLALIAWLAWLVAVKLPAEIVWPVVVVSFGATIQAFAVHRLSGAARLLLLWTVVAPCALVLLYLPAAMWPEVPTWVVWGGLLWLFSWLSVILGALWLALPDWIANLIAPLWFVTAAVLARLGVPFIRE